MKTTRTKHLIAAALLGMFAFYAGSASSQTQTPVAHSARSAEQPPKSVNTRIRELKYEAGFPTAHTVNKLYDELDFQRAVLAYQYAEPLVAFNEMNVGLNALGGTGDLFVLQHFLDPHGLALTGNSTTIYGISFLDLKKNGPMVVEVTPGSYGAFFDLWQQTIAGIGPTGADEGKGGKFLVLPMDFTGTVPPGYFPVRSRTTLAAFFARGIVRNNDVAAAAKSIEVTRIYLLAKQDNPRRPTFGLSPARTGIPLIRKDSNTGSASPPSSTMCGPTTRTRPSCSRS